MCDCSTDDEIEEKEDRHDFRCDGWEWDWRAFHNKASTDSNYKLGETDGEDAANDHTADATEHPHSGDNTGHKPHPNDNQDELGSRTRAKRFKRPREEDVAACKSGERPQWGVPLHGGRSYDECLSPGEGSRDTHEDLEACLVDKEGCDGDDEGGVVDGCEASDSLPPECLAFAPSRERDN